MSGHTPDGREQFTSLLAVTSHELRHPLHLMRLALARYFQSKGATFNDQVLNRHRNRSCCGQARDV